MLVDLSLSLCVEVNPCFLSFLRRIQPSHFQIRCPWGRQGHCLCGTIGDFSRQSVDFSRLGESLERTADLVWQQVQRILLQRLYPHTEVWNLGNMILASNWLGAPWILSCSPLCRHILWNCHFSWDKVARKGRAPAWWGGNVQRRPAPAASWLALFIRDHQVSLGFLMAMANSRILLQLRTDWALILSSAPGAVSTCWRVHAGTQDILPGALARRLLYPPSQNSSQVYPLCFSASFVLRLINYNFIFKSNINKQVLIMVYFYIFNFPQFLLDQIKISSCLSATFNCPNRYTSTFSVLSITLVFHTPDILVL